MAGVKKVKKLNSEINVRKLKTKWSAPGGLDPHRRCAGSRFAPLRWPGRKRAANKQTTLRDLSREWIGEWAEGGAVIGEPSLSLGGSDSSLTLVPRERKRRDSNRGLVITTAFRSGVDSRMSA